MMIVAEAARILQTRILRGEMYVPRAFVEHANGGDTASKIIRTVAKTIEGIAIVRFHPPTGASGTASTTLE